MASSVHHTIYHYCTRHTWQCIIAPPSRLPMRSAPPRGLRRLRGAGLPSALPGLARAAGPMRRAARITVLPAATSADISSSACS
jgi:hypothetical protein